MPVGTPRLLEFLLELRSAGVPLDIMKCVAVMRSVAGGFADNPKRLRAILHCMLASSDVARRILNEHYDRFLTEVRAQLESDELFIDEDDPDENPVPERVPENPRAEADEIQRVMELLHADPTPVSNKASPLIVRQLIDAPSSADAAELRETCGLPISLRDYLPISGRQLRQNWRYLRVPVRQGAAVEFSSRETAAKIGRTGQFSDPVMVPRRTSRSELALLIDVHGSMTPFHELVRRVAQTAEDGGRFRKVYALYFHNVPGEYLMTSPAFTRGLSLKQFFSQVPAKWASVVMLSDAGAARGTFNLERVAATLEFVQRLRMVGYRMAWLNPVPRDRWERSSAGKIRAAVAMFEITHYGFDRAIAFLRQSFSKRAQVTA